MGIVSKWSLVIVVVLLFGMCFKWTLVKLFHFLCFLNVVIFDIFSAILWYFLVFFLSYSVVHILVSSCYFSIQLFIAFWSCRLLKSLHLIRRGLLSFVWWSAYPHVRLSVSVVCHVFLRQPLMYLIKNNSSFWFIFSSILLLSPPT